MIPGLQNRNTVCDEDPGWLFSRHGLFFSSNPRYIGMAFVSPSFVSLFDLLKVSDDSYNVA